MTETEAAPPQDLSGSFLGDIIIDDTSPPENDAAPSDSNGKGNKKGKKADRTREPKDQVPIEELYDLSKPIKRVSEIIRNLCCSLLFHTHLFSHLLDVHVCATINFCLTRLNHHNFFMVDRSPQQGGTRKRNRRDRISRRCHPCRTPLPPIQD